MKHTHDPRFLAQAVHLTVPATVLKYVESAVLRSEADLVMLDLEDSIPRGNDLLLATGRANVARALHELDWGKRLRFFRPRGRELDPGLEDVEHVMRAAGKKLDGLVYPKVDGPEELRILDAKIASLEEELGLPVNGVRIAVLIESVLGEERAFEIAAASPRLSALIFGAFDYWSSLGQAGLAGERYRFDHPLVDHARARIVKAAASAGVPAIAEMTLSFPTRDKSKEEQAAALEECRRDAAYAKGFGFRGKWTGIPAQCPVVKEVFQLEDAVIDASVRAVRAFLEAEKAGRGAAMIDGEMADRATDRMHRVVLATAWATGRLDASVARELGIA